MPLSPRGPEAARSRGSPRGRAQQGAPGRRSTSSPWGRAQQGAVASSVCAEDLLGRWAVRAQRGSEHDSLGRGAARPQQGAATDLTPRSEDPLRRPAAAVRNHRGNKIPRSTLSPETEELRGLLRQDMDDCLRRIVVEEVQALRRDLREWLPLGRAASEAAQQARPFVDGTAGPLKCPAVLQPRMQPLAFSRDAIDELPSLGPAGGVGAEQPGPTSAGEAAGAPPAPAAGCGPGASHTGAGSGALEEAQQAGEANASIVASKVEFNMGSSEAQRFSEGTERRPPTTWWEWERSNNKGWAQYTTQQSGRLEKGWRSGVSRMLVRSGIAGKTPMEIYFVDMVQRDPESGNVRRIRRVGDVWWSTKAQRLCRAVTHALHTGEPIWESLGEYKERQMNIVGSKRGVDRSGRIVMPQHSGGSRHPAGDTDMPNVRFWLRRIVQARSYSSLFFLSMLVTMCYCVWVVIDSQVYPDARSIYKKDLPFTAVELCFNAFFIVELLIRIGASISVLEFVRDQWNIIDSLCVLGSLVDLIILPSWGKIAETDLTVLRTLKLFKLLRVLRLSRASWEVDIFLKGLLHGLKESSIVWAILTFMLFFFSILLTTYASDEMQEREFRSIWLCMHRLLVAGIFLDEVADLLSHMLQFGDVISYVTFVFFVIITQFIILNMLIGVISSVAGDVRGEEKTREKEIFLRSNLASIVECYIQDDGWISRGEFRLICNNTDVHKILHHFGAEVHSLPSLEKSLFARSDYIDFDTLFEAIANLNEAKVATVKDIFHAQDVLKKSLNAIEAQLAAAGVHSLVVEATSPCSPLRQRDIYA